MVKESWKTESTFYVEKQTSQNCHKNSKNEVGWRGLAHPDIKIYHKATKLKQSDTGTWIDIKELWTEIICISISHPPDGSMVKSRTNEL